MGTKLKKDLTYYMSLQYPVVIEEIPESEGGGYAVRIPALGKSTVIGDGETIDEAYQNLKEVKRQVISRALASGIPVPEPISENRVAFRL